MINKTKLFIGLSALLMAGSTYASSRMHLDGDQVASLSQIILNVVTFLVGLFINPRKKK